MPSIRSFAALLLGAVNIPVARTATPENEWRLRYAALSVSIHLDRSIVGDVRLLLDRSGSLPLVIDLADSMAVDSLATGGRRIEFDRTPATVRVADSLLAPACHRMSGTTARCDVRVWYHGIPSRTAFGIVDRAGKLRAASYGVPRSAREWWPTLDTPSQKMDSADIRIIVPRGIVAASNGLLRSHLKRDDGTEEFHWAERRPIYSDVISIAAADYIERRSSFKSVSGRAVPLSFFVFPEDTLEADADFAIVPKVLGFLEQQLGRYPFATEKYGIAEMMRPSFREHQTLPSLGASLVTGGGSVAQVIAHEAAHQWFGNSLTISDWKDIWLNESFAEYMAWRWVRATRRKKHPARASGGSSISGPRVRRRPSSPLLGRTNKRRPAARFEQRSRRRTRWRRSDSWWGFAPHSQVRRRGCGRSRFDSRVRNSFSTSTPSRPRSPSWPIGRW